MTDTEHSAALDKLIEYTKSNPMTLASGSPRRQELLAKMGLTFRVVKPMLDESAVKAVGPRALVKRLSLLKAREVQRRLTDIRANAEHGPGLIIAADTVVYLGGRVLGKPKDEAEARAMLRRLSGRTHQVYTGVTLLHGAYAQTLCARTAVRFNKLSARRIAKYVASGEPMDKAGAYGIQGDGRALVRSIRGSFENVMGLPVEALTSRLVEWINTQPPCGASRPIKDD